MPTDPETLSELVQEYKEIAGRVKNASEYDPERAQAIAETMDNLVLSLPDDVKEAVLELTESTEWKKHLPKYD